MPDEEEDPDEPCFHCILLGVSLSFANSIGCDPADLLEDYICAISDLIATIPDEADRTAILSHFASELPKRVRATRPIIQPNAEGSELVH